MTLFDLIRRRRAIHVGLMVIMVAFWLSSTQNEEQFMVSGDYDVFLSFRGRDTPTGFPDFLYRSLNAAGVRVFREDDNLPTGEKISVGLIRGIRSSKISIPIISQDYAGSKYCLQELAEMITCREKGRQFIFPIFYKVTKDEVQELNGRLGKALHSLKGTVDGNATHQWEEGLRSVAKIKGWESDKMRHGHQEVLVSMVVAKVLSELKAISLNSAVPFHIIHWATRAARYLIRKTSDGAEGQYQVFLNFYEEDIQISFIDSLYISLANAGVRVFSIDDPSLIGKDLAEEVYNAIKSSKISIPIISQHYASSIYCLQELAQMVDKKKTRQKLIPIFYNVKPTQVRRVTDEYREALTLHRSNSVHESVVTEWEQALRVIGASKGPESKKVANGHEGTLVGLVVQEVLRELNKAPLSSKYNAGSNFSAWLLSTWQETDNTMKYTSAAILVAFLWTKIKIKRLSLVAILGYVIFKYTMKG